MSENYLGLAAIWLTVTAVTAMSGGVAAAATSSVKPPTNNSAKMSNKSPSARVGVISSISPAAAANPASTSGSAQVTRAGKTLAVHPGDTIQSDDTIEAASDTTVLLERGDVRVAALLKAGSKATVVGSGETLELRLDHGGILSDVHNPSKRKQPFRILTRTAVMGVRGTVFFVKANEGQPDFLCTCAGVVEVKSRPVAGAEGVAEEGAVLEGVVFKSKHHDAPKTIAAGEGPLASRVQPAAMGADHRDEEAADLEKALERR
jgi:ferric-dicitrate binding protein FerR (iron transport regulator)